MPQLDPLQVAERFMELVYEPDFLALERGIADEVIGEVSARWNAPPPQSHEPGIVEGIIAALRAKPSVRVSSSAGGVLVKTDAAFIHGPGAVYSPRGKVNVPGSQVVFRHFSAADARCELGDLLLVASVVHGGQKFFERCTFVQLKKSHDQLETSRWDVESKQLYLLSRFPTFAGYKGSLVTRGPHAVANSSGSLGSFGFLYAPGDFAFVSARRFAANFGNSDHVLGSELRRLAKQDFNKDRVPPCVAPSRVLGRLPPWERLRHLANWPAWPVGTWPEMALVGNVTYLENTHELIRCYFSLNLGEPTKHAFLPDDLPTRALLGGFFENARRIGEKRNLTDLQAVGEGFRKFPYYQGGREDDIDSDLASSPRDRDGDQPEDDFGGGGLGIVHATINLGE
jgi:hypothetical protein